MESKSNSKHFFLKRVLFFKAWDVFSKWFGSSYSQQVIYNAVMMLENTGGDFSCVQYTLISNSKKTDSEHC